MEFLFKKKKERRPYFCFLLDDANDIGNVSITIIKLPQTLMFVTYFSSDLSHECIHIER